ncbi:TonB-dependent receptor [Novosphingobium sp. KA1]|uniref:TonB-dependent receptor n=1 Tax=Novosphingobium sp. (strain KA1) TaxID=164608 RepID=UPI001A8DA33C|nr:TonB-dependent receptor [Novosphingobium sp. KA1]QSR19717.1 hypothetical protein CA833_21475 [Novosphingobium sp. KA1]
MPPEKSSQNDWIPTGGIEVVHMGKRTKLGLLGATALASILLSSPAAADPAGKQHYNLEAGALGDALQAVSRLSGREIIFSSEAVIGRRAPRLEGTYSADEAVRRLLSGSGLKVQYRKDVILIGGRSEATDDAGEGSLKSADIVVTGSRIAGAPPASQVISMNREQIDDSGHTNLPEVLAAIPQNFGGGQNPGVGFNVPVGNGENVGSSSSINLRGLGPDATLTLVNGHRLAYGGYRQSIDVSSIPFLAVEAIQIVPDGASAIYGSDAVAGVANILLRRRFEGLQVQTTLGASTDGGNTEQIYSAMGGLNWSSGNILIAYEYGKNTAIDASQRSYTREVNPGLTLYPAMSHHNVAMSSSTQIVPAVTAGLDVLANWRTARNGYALSGDPAVPRYDIASPHFSLAVAPSLRWDIGEDWSLSVNGTFGIDRVKTKTDQVSGATATPAVRSCFCNSSWSVEAGATGRIFSLPAGDAKIALGGGLRSNTLHSKRTVGSVSDIKATQNVQFAYAEIAVPLVASAGILQSLSANGAARFEHYSGIASVTTPKFGLVADLSGGVKLRASWGRSFRAPTLFQLYGDPSILLRPASIAGGTGLPATATILQRTGGNTDLKPERATTWSAGIEFKPAFAPGLKLEATYFNIRYQNRIVQPIPYLSRALSDPVYAAYVQRNPSASDQESLLAQGTFLNLTTAAYDPGNVAAIIEFNYTNAASQWVDGIDFLAQYDLDLGDSSHLQFVANAGYLHSSQRLSPLQSTNQVAGTLFNPPNWRARGGGTWKGGNTTLSAFGNYTGGVTDVRTTSEIPVPGMFTLDLVAGYEIQSSVRALDGLVVRLSAQNVLNDKPSQIATSAAYLAAYDSTNYSAFGRVISFTISQTF